MVQAALRVACWHSPSLFRSSLVCAAGDKIHHLSFLFSPLPSGTALRPLSVLRNKDDDSYGDPNTSTSSNAHEEKKSRNALKREARRAVQWGMELSKFSITQIKCVVQVAELDNDVLDALMLVKRLGPDVREGKRRQFNYIGKLLRNAPPGLMDKMIQALKDGDNSLFVALSNGQEYSWSDDDEIGEVPTQEKEDGEEYVQLAMKWFDGLISKDPSITQEVYSVHNVEYDRQGLRKLVRNAQFMPVSQLIGDADETSEDGATLRVKNPLLNFLRSLAKKTLEA